MNRFVSVAVGMVAALLLHASAYAADALPTGVKRIAFGQAVVTGDPSHGGKCTIPNPLRSPVEFEAGVLQIAYLVEIDPHGIKRVKTSVLGDFGSPDTNETSCNANSICRGSLCQTQFGRTMSRSDHAPLKSGSYTLVVEIDGKATQVPFTIK